MTTYAPGDHIPSRCNKCNDVTGHIIMAVVGGEIVKVECKACKGVHRYKAPESTPRPRKEVVQRVKAGEDRKKSMKSPTASSTTAPKTKAKARSDDQMENMWRQALNKHIGQVRPYSMQEHFSKDEVLEHPSFGQGIVKEFIAPDKVRILFQDGLKLLRCAG